MKTAQIIHNPTAGDGRHSKKNLIDFVEAAGFTTKYASTDDASWESFYKNNPDVIFLAGGDGTVRKLVGVLLNKSAVSKHIPIWILPLGTANNITKSLKIPMDYWPEISDISESTKLKFDCGQITGLQQESFFLESIGFGVFPELISEMQKVQVNTKSPADKLKFTLKILHKLVKEVTAKTAIIKTKEETIKDSFLMVELMNIELLGPNLKLAPHARAGDGFFDLVMVQEEHREQLLEYVEALIANEPVNGTVENFVKTIRVQEIEMQWDGKSAHVDDNLVQNYNGQNVRIKTLPHAIEFFNAKSR